VRRQRRWPADLPRISGDKRGQRAKWKYKGIDQERVARRHRPRQIFCVAEIPSALANAQNGESMSTVEEKVRSYIMMNFMFTDDGSALVNSDSLLGKGIIDSTGILEVIHFLDDEFEIKVADEEMIPDNLDSVDNIVAFVARKKNAG